MKETFFLQGSKNMLSEPELQNSPMIGHSENKSNQRRLSPWFSKRRNSKYSKTERNEAVEQKTEQAEYFLRRIFPHKNLSEFEKQKNCVDVIVPSIKSSLRIKTDYLDKKAEDEVFAEFVYLPIKAMKKKMDKTTQESLMKKTFCHNSIESEVNSHKLSLYSMDPQVQRQKSMRYEPRQRNPININFIRRWKKKEKKESAIKNWTKKQEANISMKQILSLIGSKKSQSQPHTQAIKLLMPKHNPEDNFAAKKAQQQKWCVPRSFKHNKFNTIASNACKTVYI